MALLSCKIVTNTGISFLPDLPTTQLLSHERDFQFVDRAGNRHLAIQALQAFGHVALRLISLGRTAGLIDKHRLEADGRLQVHLALTATLDDLGGSAIIMDGLTMKHSSLTSRIFLS